MKNQPSRIHVPLPCGFKPAQERIANLDLSGINAKLQRKLDSGDPVLTSQYQDCRELHDFVKDCLNSGIQTLSVRVIGKPKTGSSSYYVACSVPGKEDKYFAISTACLPGAKLVPAELRRYSAVPLAA